MTGIVPASRPDMAHDAALALLAALHVDVTKPALLGRRGYYRDTMGVVGADDLGLYDDAILLVSPTAYVTFNANTDPSRERDGMATLAAGVWRYRLGIHGLSHPITQQYIALVQADDVVVHRWGTDAVPAHTFDARGECLGAGRWTGRFGINIHRGGYTTTSSEGCQTLYPDQWPTFIALVQQELQRHAAPEIPYVLTERAPAPSPGA